MSERLRAGSACCPGHHARVFRLSVHAPVSGAAAREGLGLVEYLSAIFSRVSWGEWLELMIPYFAFFFLLDSLIVWRVVSWFNTPIRYTDVLPIRGSSYILSILNEQVGKGAMGLYLNRRYGVPGWEVGSSMIFIFFNAAIGLLFLRRANRELFDGAPA